jgi:hypothetical protein
MNLDEVLNQLRRGGYTPTRGYDSQWYSHCPAHDDERASLSLTEKGGTLLIKCHAGCEFRDVIEAIKELESRPLLKREPVPVTKEPIKRDPVPIIRREPVREGG